MEDLICGWVSKRKKRKAAVVELPLPPAKKRATEEKRLPSSPEVRDSDADDEDDEGKRRVDDHDDRGRPGWEEDLDDNSQPAADEDPDDERQPAADDPDDDSRPAGQNLGDDSQPAPEENPDDSGQQLAKESQHPESVAPGGTPDAPHIVSSIEGITGKVEPTAVRVIPSSQDSTSSQSGSDSQTHVAKIEKDAKAALHQIEVATSVQVSQKHRRALIGQSLAFAGRDALESFRQACSYWRSDYASQTSQGLVPQISSIERHPALERFARAYSTATDTTLRRAVLDILHRINLAYLYEVYLETLEALSRFSLQQNASRSNAGRRALDVFDKDVRDIAQDQMFWACHPMHAGKPRRGIDGAFKVRLKNAEKWHTLREEYSIGMLALVPPGANNWFEKLPLPYLPIYFYLIRAVNPLAVSMGEAISERVLASWRGEEPPKQLLRMEHLETVDETYLRANPLKLLEEVNVGCISGRPIGRAVTMPADIDEHNTAALGIVFSSVAGVGQGDGEYEIPPGFFDEIDLLDG